MNLKDRMKKTFGSKVMKATNEIIEKKIKDKNAKNRFGNDNDNSDDDSPDDRPQKKKSIANKT